MRNAEHFPSKSEVEQPVPLSWRPVLTQIADRLVEGDYSLCSRPPNVGPVDNDLAELIEQQVASYGDELSCLLEETWEKAMYLWVGEHWEVLVDLCTKTEGVSDLGLFVKVFDQTENFRFQVWSVHVP